MRPRLRSIAAVARALALAFALIPPVFLDATVQPAEPNAFAIVGARIVDGTGAAPVTGTVIVRDGKITAAGPDVPVPRGLPTIDGAGRTLTPGLFDLHVHLLARASNPLAPDIGKHLAAYLYCGVTSVAELGSDPESFAPFRALLASGALKEPHVSFAARMAVPGGHGAEAGRADLHTALVVTPRDAEAAVRRLVPYQPDLIKVFADGWRYNTEPNLPSMEPPTLAIITRDARAQGWPIFTHTVTVEGATEAMTSGVTTLAHGIGDADVDAALPKELRARGMTYVSTLSVYEPRDHRRTTPLLSKVIEPVQRKRLEAAPSAVADSVIEARKERWEHLIANVGLLHKAGVRLGVGTDAGMPSAPHGWSTLLELRLLVEAGLTPLEALTAATGNSAAALGVSADRGTIAVGKRADLVLVAGDPTKDVAQMEQIERVFVDGREVDRPALTAMITGEAMSPLAPASITAPLIDDFEGNEDRSDRGARWMNATDPGPHTTRMVFDRVRRTGTDHALHMSARMSDDDRPFARVWLSLMRGGLQPADVSRFTGLRFEARGDGEYRLVLATRRVRDGRFHQTTFRGTPVWRTIELPFARFTQSGKGEALPWTGLDLLELAFEAARKADTTTWLEIDNVRFYQTPVRRRQAPPDLPNVER